MRSAFLYGWVALNLCACTGEFPTSPQSLRAAEAHFDKELLVRSLNEIEAWHVRNNTGVAGSLGAGKRPAAIAAAFAGTECSPTEELKTLWAWHDGESSPVPFVWYHDFLPLNDALAEYRRLLLNPLVQWDPRYVPIFSFEGEWYAAYCGKGARSSGPIAHFFLEDEPRTTYVNLTTFAASMAEALGSGAVRWHKDAMVEDIRALRLIHRKYNRGLEFPYYVPEGS